MTLRGIEGKLFINTGVDYATPTWTEITCVRDATLDLQNEEADATCRGGGGFRASAVTVQALEVSGNAIKDKSDAGFAALEAVAQNKTLGDFVFLDGPINSNDSDGYRFEGHVFGWTENQPFEDIIAMDFTLKPGPSSNAPVTFQGSSS